MYSIAYGAINISIGFISFFYIFMKAINHSASRKYMIFSILWCILLGVLYAIIPLEVPYSLVIVIYCMASILFIIYVVKLESYTVISAFLLSFGIGYALYYAASFIIGLVFMPFASVDYMTGTTIDYNNPIHLLIYSLTSALQLVLSLMLFRIRRFKSGFPFLFKGYANIIAFITAGTMLILVMWGKSLTEEINVYTAYLYLSGLFIIGVGVYLWIKRGIRMVYRKKQEARGIELLERELAGQQEENRRLITQNDILRAANHKIQHRLAALERSVIAMSGCSMDAGEELTVTLEDIKRIARDYQNDISRLEGKQVLPSTKIKMLDDVFKDFSARFTAAQIDFKLTVNGSIPYMTENIIEQSKLETMIGDHLQNALVAIHASGNTFRSVWAIMGVTEGCYELSVLDSGIPFEVDTLVRLGAERVTTHAENGGSGIGFMTTFECLRECNASLVICEKRPSSSDYTKSVTIRFDGQSQYIIETYRFGEFPLSDRYIVTHEEGYCAPKISDYIYVNGSRKP